MIDPEGRLENIPHRNRRAWYVDGTNGAAANSGTDPRDAFDTIGAAINAAIAGDIIHISEDVYDEAVSVPAALVGLEIICEPGTVLQNTTPGTVVSIAATHVVLSGCQINQPGQIGLAVAGGYFTGRNILITGTTICFDMDGIAPLMINCRCAGYDTTGFDIFNSNGVYINCFAQGQPASRGFYLSNTAAEENMFLHCMTLGCTAAGYETVAGADDNLFAFCSQSSLCAGPTDAGANNTWASHSQDSQITAGNTLQEDLAAIETLVDGVEASQGRMLFTLDFWSEGLEEVQIGDGVAGATVALPDITVADLPAGATVVRAVVMFKFRMVENTYAGVNKLNGATVASTSQVIQIRDDSPGTYYDAINFVDDFFTLADSAREGGDVIMGQVDVAGSGKVDANDTYNLRWLLARADQDYIQFNDVQVGLRIWYSV